MIKKESKNTARLRKHTRVRKKVSGTTARPRLCVFRSLSNVYAQIIDDNNGVTLVAASTLDGELRGKVKFGGNIEASAAVGKLLAEKAIAKDIKQVVFDRGGYIYHGRVKALAEAAREGGLEF